MASIASRASWGARHANGDLNLSGLAVAVVLHHTVTAQPPANATVAQERAIMRGIEAIGQRRFGTGISYNVLIFPSGRAYQGVSFNRRGTHTGGHNSTVRSISFVGNYETKQPTAAALRTAAAIVTEGRGKWWRRDAPVMGHRQYSSTLCPGKNVYSKRSQIANGRITGGSTGATAYGSATANHSVGSRMMSLYDGGADVRWLQTELTKLGYNVGKADGLFGPATERVVRAYQRDRGFQVDGLVGPETISGLRGGSKEVAKGSQPTAPQRLGVDGKWGNATTRRLQQVLGTPVDGIVSRQPVVFRDQNPGLLAGWEWTKSPGKSNVIEALQRRLGVSADGRIGPNTIRALQRKLDTPADGRVSNPSQMVRALQRNLNAGKLW